LEQRRRLSSIQRVGRSSDISFQREDLKQEMSPGADRGARIQQEILDMYDSVVQSVDSTSGLFGPVIEPILIRIQRGEEMDVFVRTFSMGLCVVNSGTGSFRLTWNVEQQLVLPLPLQRSSR
jgi:Mg2+/citrate symporter